MLKLRTDNPPAILPPFQKLPVVTKTVMSHFLQLPDVTIGTAGLVFMKRIGLICPDRIT